jgi:hypothetical protein
MRSALRAAALRVGSQAVPAAQADLAARLAVLPARVDPAARLAVLPARAALPVALAAPAQVALARLRAGRARRRLEEAAAAAAAAAAVAVRRRATRSAWTRLRRLRASSSGALRPYCRSFSPLQEPSRRKRALRPPERKCSGSFHPVATGVASRADASLREHVSGADFLQAARSGNVGAQPPTLFCLLSQPRPGGALEGSPGQYQESARPLRSPPARARSRRGPRRRSACTPR